MSWITTRSISRFALVAVMCLAGQAGARSHLPSPDRFEVATEDEGSGEGLEMSEFSNAADAMPGSPSPELRFQALNHRSNVRSAPGAQERTEEACIKSLYRYYATTGGVDHFYTTNFSALYSGTGDWGYEGMEGALFSPSCNTVSANFLPLLRYYNASQSDHFYTITEKNYPGYVLESRTEGNCYRSQVKGTVPLYRYYSQDNSDHFYTTNFSELWSGGYSYSYEGIECYVAPYVSPTQSGKVYVELYLNADGNYYGAPLAKSAPYGSVVSEIPFSSSYTDSKGARLTGAYVYPPPCYSSYSYVSNGGLPSWSLNDWAVYGTWAVYAYTANHEHPSSIGLTISWQK